MAWPIRPSAELLASPRLDRPLFLRQGCLRYFFIALLLSSNSIAAEEDRRKPESPMIYDAMMFSGKPDLGLSSDVGFVYEWEATHRDEAQELAAQGNKSQSSARTIEAEAFFRAVTSRGDQFKYLVIDIETLKIEDDPIAIEYVELAKAAAAPGVKLAWWNTGPSVVVDTSTHPFNRSIWLDDWRKRHDLERANDFLIFGSYFSKSQTLESWAKREIPRVIEARRQFPEKLLFVTIAPHPFDAGMPWRHVSAKFFGGAMDRLAQAGVDGIVIWSVEKPSQTWDESWEWVSALRSRIGLSGHYRAP